MFGRFTERAQRVIVLSQEEARRLGHNVVGTEHLLLGLIAEGEGVAARALQTLDISIDKVRAEIERVIGRGEAGVSGPSGFTRALLRPRASLLMRLGSSGTVISAPNIFLLGLIREGEGVAAQVLINLGADLDKVRSGS